MWFMWFKKNKKNTRIKDLLDSKLIVRQLFLSLSLKNIRNLIKYKNGIFCNCYCYLYIIVFIIYFVKIILLNYFMQLIKILWLFEMYYFILSWIYPLMLIWF